MEKWGIARKMGGAVGEIWEDRGREIAHVWLACVLVFLPTYLPEFELVQAYVNTHTHTTFKFLSYWCNMLCTISDLIYFRFTLGVMLVMRKMQSMHWWARGRECSLPQDLAQARQIKCWWSAVGSTWGDRKSYEIGVSRPNFRFPIVRSILYVRLTKTTVQYVAGHSEIWVLTQFEWPLLISIKCVYHDAGRYTFSLPNVTGGLAGGVAGIE